MRRWPRSDEQVHAPADATDIVGDDGVDVGADGGTVEAHDRRAAGDDRAEVRLVDRRRHDEQRHDPPLDHRRDDLGLAVGAVTRRGRQDEAVAAADHRLDALQHAGPERVADARRDDADHRRRAPGAQQAGELVGPEAELLGGAPDPGDLVGPHVALVVEGPGHGLRRDPGAAGDVADRGRPAGRRGLAHRTPSAALPATVVAASSATSCRIGVAGDRVGDGGGGVGDPVGDRGLQRPTALEADQRRAEQRVAGADRVDDGDRWRRHEPSTSADRQATPWRPADTSAAPAPASTSAAAAVRDRLRRRRPSRSSRSTASAPASPACRPSAPRACSASARLGLTRSAPAAAASISRADGDVDGDGAAALVDQLDQAAVGARGDTGRNAAADRHDAPRHRSPRRPRPRRRATRRR